MVLLHGIGIRRQQPVVQRVHGTVKEGIVVHQAVPEVLPRVEDQHCHEELPQNEDDVTAGYRNLRFTKEDRLLLGVYTLSY